MFPIWCIERVDDLSALRDDSLERRFKDAEAVGAQRNKLHPAVYPVAAATDKATTPTGCEACGYCPGSDYERARQLGWPQFVGGAAPNKCGEHLVLAEVQIELLEGASN